MRTRDKQNKYKLKFIYITHLQKLGKIWKEHCKILNSSMSKSNSSYNYEVVKLMNKSTKEEYCSILDKCDDLAVHIRKVDASLKMSHKNFSKYKKIILDG